MTANNRPSSLADDDNLSELRLVLTDPDSGKQLRIFCNRPKLMTESSDSFFNNRKREFEFFCQNLQYSDSSPSKSP